jgi:hypothetical protein
MTAPFAALEARVNAAVVSHLANATADFGGGVVVNGEFGRSYSEAMGVVAGNELSLRVIESAVPGVVVAGEVVIGGVTYVINRIESDGAGMTTMQLVEA